MKKPEPISKYIVCTECGINWEAHGDKPTLEDCVRLLKVELERKARPARWVGALSGSDDVDVTSLSGIPLDSNTRMGKIQ